MTPSSMRTSECRGEESNGGEGRKGQESVSRGASEGVKNAHPPHLLFAPHVLYLSCTHELSFTSKRPFDYYGTPYSCDSNDGGSMM